MRARQRLALLLTLFALAEAGCKRAERHCPDDQAAAVDPVLLAFLSRARSAHHLADGGEQAGDLDGAVRPLEALVNGAKPAGEARPEVREVLADTHARLADLYGRQGKLPQAFAAIDAGLGLVSEPTYFRGHLLEVRGLLEERRAEALTKDGKADEAKAARERALEAFEDAMRIQADVIDGSAPARH